MKGWTLALWIVSGCASGPGAGKDQAVETDVVSIRIAPDSADLVTNGETPGEVEFVAWATMKDGSELPTTMVTWETSNLSAGTVDEDGVFVSSMDNGGVSEITATHVGIAGQALVTVVYEADLLVDDASDELIDAFAAASATGGDLPEMVYPLDGVNVPRNLEGLAFQWEMPDDTNVSRIRLRSDITDIRVHVESNVWYSTADLWALIVASNTEGSVQVSIEAGSWDGSALSDVQRGPWATLTVNRLDARGSVLYWVARAGGPEPAGDIMRIPFGATVAEVFWSAEDSDGQCTGCHTLAERANRMVVTHQGVNGTFSVIDITDPDSPALYVAPSGDRRVTFHALSPDGQHMLGVVEGVAKLYSLVDGGVISEIDTQGHLVSHPNWAPDGEDVLLVRATGSFMSDMSFDGGEIIQMSFSDGSFGTPEVLVERSSSYNNYYPAYSPDGQWIAFNRAVETEITDPAGNTSFSSTCYANPSAELWLMRRDGSDRIRLDAANGVGELQNSFPRWGPLPDDDVLWIAYSSKRSYIVDPNMEMPQIWVSAIDPTKVEAGDDPSSPPFWLPGQDSQSDNHLAIWWSK